MYWCHFRIVVEQEVEVV